MKKNSMRLLGFLLVAVMMVSLLGLGVFAGDTANDVNETASQPSETLTWKDGDVIDGITISKDVTINVSGTVTVNGTIRLAPDAICNVVFNGSENAKLIRGEGFTGQMFYAEGTSDNFQKLTFNNITLDGGAVWTGDVDKTLNRGTTNSGVKATGSVLYLVYANATLENGSVLQNHDDSTGEKANAVFLRYYSTFTVNDSVVRNNHSISTYYRGGVVTIRQGGTVKTNNADVYGNSGAAGGFVGISSTGSYGGIAEVKNSKFHNNYADNGAVFLMQCNSKIGYLSIEGCEFYENASKTAVLTEWAYSRPFIIKDSYFHDNECAVWDCHADPVLDLSGKIVVEEDADYTKYLFETPLVLGGALTDGSSIAISEASLTKLLSTKSYVVTGTADYAITNTDLAKFVLPEGYEFLVADVNFDGIMDAVSVDVDFVVSQATITLKDSLDADASETRTVIAGLAYDYGTPSAHTGFTFTGWQKDDGKAVNAPIAVTSDSILTAQWKLANPSVAVSVNGATLTATISNANEDIAYTYQWYIDGTAIDGATADTYTMTDLASHKYRCTVTASYEGYKSTSGNREVTASVPAAAQIGDVKYETLAEAIAAANAADGATTVTLLADVTLSEKLTITGDVTIEGAYTITRANTYTGTLFAVEAGATLTLDGGLTIDGGNNWAYTVFPPVMDLENGSGTKVADHITPAEGGVNATAHMIVNNGTLNVLSVTIENSYSTGGFSLINAGANSVTILDGATIRHTAANRSGAVANIGGIDAILTIKGTTRITDNFGVGNGGIIQNYGQGTTVNFEGGSIDNNFVGSSGTLYASYSSNANKINTFNMTGGIITENVMEGYGPVYIHTNTVWNMSGGEISENVSYLPSYVRNNNPAGSMTGGKIANNEIAGLDYGGGYYLTHPDLRLNGKTAITGGIYSQNVFEYLAPNSGLAYDDGLYTVVSEGLFKLHLTDPVTGEPATLPYIEGNVLASLVATGKLFYADYYEMTLEVLYDVKVDETVVIDYPMTIDLNGHTITGYSTMQTTPVFRVVSDVTVIGEGKVDGRPGSACYAFIVGQGENAGNLTIENGTFYGDTSAISVTKGTATINGGKFAVTPYQVEGEEDNYNFLLNCIDKNYKDGTAKIVVKGGTFYKFNPADNAAEGAGTSFVHENYLAEADGDYYTVRVNKDTLPTVADVVIKLEGGQTITLTYPSERFDTIQKLIGTNDYADFVLGAEQSELLAYVANGDVTDIVMNLYDDIELDAPINFYNKYFQIPVEYAITVNGNGHTISWADGYNGTLINVENGVDVTLKDLTIDGENSFTFYDDTTTVENGQNWYTRFVDVGEEDKAINDNVIVNAGNLTLDSVRITGVTIASDGPSGKTENTESGYVLMYNDDLALIKSNGGKVTINGGAIMYNAGMVLNAINAETSLNTNVMYNMGAGNKGGIIIANGGTMDIKGVITYNKAMARSATVLGVINGAEVTFNAVMNYNEHIGVGPNTAGAMIVLEGTSQFVMNGGTINYNEGGRAGAIASRWVGDKDISIVLNAGSIIGNTASNDSWNGASIFLRSPATIGEGMTIDGTIAVNAAPGALEITGGTFNNFDMIVTDGLTAEITGGTFDSDPTEWVAEGYEATDNGDGTYSVTLAKLAKVEVEIIPGFWGTGYITVENWADLVAALGENTNVPVKVTLLKDIKLTDEGLTIAGTAKKVIDLNGHTITGMLVNYAELIVNDETQNGKIEGGPVAVDNYGALTVNGGFFTGEYGAIYNNELQSGKATVVIYGGEFTAPGDWYATIENRYGVLTVNGGKIVATNRGGYAIVDTCGETTINGGEIVSADGTAVETYQGKIVIKDGSFVGKVIVENQEGNVTVYGGTLVSNTPEYYYGMTNANGGVTVLYGGTYERDYATAEGTSVKIAEGHISVANGENFTVVPGSENVLEIWDVDDLMTFAALANSGNNFSGWTVNLMADIDLGGMTWTPIASFAGNFVGNNHIISNFHIDATSASGGFFNVIASSNGLEDVKVKDLILSDVTATVGNARFGTLANSIQGVVHNVTVKNITVTTTHTNAWVGGMAAFMSWPWMTNCTVENLVVDATAGADLIGGFACILQKNSNHVFDNLDVKGFKVTVTDTDASGCGVGGFVAQTQRGWENPKIINSDITGIDITASGLVDVGGFIAWPGAHTIAENCHTSGKIDVTGVTSDGCFAGGFFGDLGWNCDLGQMGHKVIGCTADVDIITKIVPAGGFIGSATNSNNNSMYATFTDCVAKGDVTVVEGGTANIGGFAGNADRGMYTDCVAEGTLTNNGTGYTGGFIGYIKDTTPKYDGRYPAGTRDYLVDVLTFDTCKGSVDPFIGAVADTKPASELVNKDSYVASVGNAYYADFENAVAAAQVGDIKDIVLHAPVVITEDTTLDLTGLTVDGNGVYPAFRIQNGANVTVKGGTVTNSDYVFVLGASDGSSAGNLTIESGSYTGTTSVISVTKGTLTVLGGEFKTAESEYGATYLLNCIDANYKDGSAKIIVKGGTFYKFNPENNAAEGAGTDFVPETHISVDNGDDTYTVINYIQWIKDQLLAGNDVTLDRDVVVNSDYTTSEDCQANGFGQYKNWGIFTVISGDVTFDLNGHNVTYTGHSENFCNKVAEALFYANNGAKLTIVDSSADKTGSVDVYGMATAVYSTGVGSVATVKGGTWNGYGCPECGAFNIFLYASHGGELYIEDGYFSQNGLEDSSLGSILIVEHSGAVKNLDALVDYSQTKVEITGGTFVGMDPEQAVEAYQKTWSSTVWGNTNVVAEGKMSYEVKENVWIIISADIVVKLETEGSDEVKFFSSIAEAMAEARLTAGNDTISLLKDHTESIVLVYDGTILNVEDKTLTANYLVVFKGGFLTGNAYDKDGAHGQVKIDKDRVVITEGSLPQGQGYILPVWNEDHYVFGLYGALTSGSKYGFDYDAETDTIDLTFKVKATTDINDDIMKLKGHADHGLSVIVHLEWMGSDGLVAQDYIYTDEMVQACADFNLYNFSIRVGERTDMRIVVKVVSDTGATLSSAEYVHNG